MTSIFAVRKLPCLVVLCLLSPLVLAQTEGTSQRDQLAVAQERVKELQAELETARESDRNAYTKELERAATNLGLALNPLVSGIGESGETDSQMLEQVQESVASLFEILHLRIDETHDRLEALYEQLKDSESDADASGALAGMANSERLLDRLYGEYLANLDRARAVNVDPVAHERYFDELIQHRATRISGRIALLIEGRDTLMTSRAGTDTGSDERKRIDQSLSVIDTQIDAHSKNLNAEIAFLEARGVDAAEYKEQLIAATGQISKHILDRKVAGHLIAQWWNNLLTWLRESGPSVVFNILTVLLILTVFYWLTKVVRGSVGRFVTRRGADHSQLLQDFLIAMAGNVVFLIGLIVALSQVGIDVGPMLAGLGIAGIVIGFALQNTLSNFAAGVMILIYRPYDVGDLVEVAGATGKVKAMSLVSTTITTFDNERLIVPNAKILGDVIRNMTAEYVRRVDLVFCIGYDDDEDEAERILRDVVEGHEKVLDQPEPVVHLHELADSSVNFIVRPWVKTDDYWPVYWDVTKEVKTRFDATGITIPYPQQEVTFRNAETTPGPDRPIPGPRMSPETGKA